MKKINKNWQLTEIGQDLLEHYSKIIDKLQSARRNFKRKTGKDLTENQELMILNFTRRNRFYGGSF